MHGICSSVYGLSSHEHSSTAQSIQTDYQHSNKAQIITLSPDTIKPIPLTKQTFFDEYGMGKSNLSVVSQPSCICQAAFLKAPEAYTETDRLKAVARFIDLPQWKNHTKFSMLLKKIQNLLGTNGASISLIDARYQLVKYQVGLDFGKCARQISLDAHTILSKDFLSIADTTQDWRTKSNPLVKGSPYIKYYVGVPLITPDNQAIGVIAGFGPFPRKMIDQAKIKDFKLLAEEVMQYLRSNDEIKEEVTESPFLFQNNKTILSRFGRATSTVSETDISFERDGSGTSYRSNMSVLFSRYELPYDDLIDIRMWKQLQVCKNFRVTCNLLCRLLLDRFKLNCVYILQVKTSQPGKIPKYTVPRNQEIPISEFQFRNKLTICGDESARYQMMGIQGRLQGLDLDYMKQFHMNCIRSKYGMEYRSSDAGVIFHSGICVPFYHNPEKMVRRNRKIHSTDTNVDVYIRGGGYLIGCFTFHHRHLTNEEIGYIYGSASIIRRLYLMKN